MIISYPTRSRFLPACEAAISSNRKQLGLGSSIVIQFPSEFSGKGYNGSVQVHIDENQQGFSSDWKGADETRFPARIRATALALFNQKCFGSYKVVHQDGRIEITNLSSPSQKPLRKKIKKSQHTDGVRINKSHQEIFNPPDTKFYVAKGTSREITVHFNGKTFEARYLRENPQGTDREMQSIRFSQELKEEFQKVSPNLEGSFSISLGADPSEFHFTLRDNGLKTDQRTINFTNLRVGEEYDRPFLAKNWGYKGYQAISKGVVTPSDTKIIILFVTKEKQEALTQYNDYIDGDLLFWEGEERHGSDQRIIDATKNNDEIHLFFRDIHHSPFVYHGQIYLQDHQLNNESPSEFIFRIGGAKHQPDALEDIEAHKIEYKNLDKTEQDSVVKSRIGQGAFRDNLIKLWGSCAVTGVKTLSLLKASHIKPWRDSSNKERLDPYNGLLLTPNLDELFDSGFISFDSNGYIQISDKLSQKDRKLLGVGSELKLRKQFAEIEEYLNYHRDNVFMW